MPGYKGHVFGAAALGAASLAGLNWLGWYTPDFPEAVLLMVFVLLGGIFPDVDTDSVAQKLFYTVLLLTNVTLMIQGHYKWAAILGFCAMLPVVAGHRGWIHTWWAMFLVPLTIFILPVLFYQVKWQYLVPFYTASVFGYFIHLLLDRKFI